MKFFLTILATQFFAETDLYAAVSEEQFRREMREHREWMIGQASEFLTLYTAQYPGVTPDLLVRYLASVHDIPKLLSLNELQHFRYTHRESIAARLARFHGRAESDLSFAGKLELQKSVKDLNAVEAELRNSFIESEQLGPRVLISIREIEIILDVLHVKMYRGIELNITPTPFAASKFILEKYKNPAAAEIARDFETRIRKKQNRLTCQNIFEN